MTAAPERAPRADLTTPDDTDPTDPAGGQPTLEITQEVAPTILIAS